MARSVYAVERRAGDAWTVVGERLFADRAAAEHAREKYVEDDFSGRLEGAAVRVREYDLVDSR